MEADPLCLERKVPDIAIILSSYLSSSFGPNTLAIFSYLLKTTNILFCRYSTGSPRASLRQHPPPQINTSRTLAISTPGLKAQENGWKVKQNAMGSLTDSETGVRTAESAINIERRKEKNEVKANQEEVAHIEKEEERNK